MQNFEGKTKCIVGYMKVADADPMAQLEINISDRSCVTNATYRTGIRLGR